jgi:hypothetical protein
MFREKSYFQKKNILKGSNFLDLKPIVKYQHETDDEGNVVVLVPRFTGYISSRLLQPRLKNPWFKISLDEIGSVVWTLADGKTPVREICRHAEKKLGEKIHPANQRVTTFLSQLYMKKLITFVEILK